ncbi:MAG: LuxR family transcriptional regulator [Caulobacterales bacterium 32-69-10]|nr:MAG: LuxR family transcriptional regulator [Caulobacterales bacterium 32-69-10]
MLIDSHVNLHAHQFDEDRDAVIARAREAGVRLMVEISDKVSSFEATHALAMAHPDIWCTVGTHPHEAKEDPALTGEALAALAARDRVVGIGECGLDYYYDLSPRDVQRAVFQAHIDAARATGLPLVVHTRDADEDMIRMLESGCIGAFFSVSGIATFKAAETVRAVIADMPEDRIIVETDCPYLAPVPMRGRRNEPAYVVHVLDKLAQIRGWGRDEAEAKTEAAFFNLFDRIPRPSPERPA